MTVRVITGEAFAALRDMPDESVHCVVTSPPYWGLRSYGGDPGMIGLAPTFEEHLESLVSVFREVRRALRSDGRLWLNFGASPAMLGAVEHSKKLFIDARKRETRRQREVA